MDYSKVPFGSFAFICVPLFGEKRGKEDYGKENNLIGRSLVLRKFSKAPPLRMGKSLGDEGKVRKHVNM